MICRDLSLKYQIKIFIIAILNIVVLTNTNISTILFKPPILMFHLCNVWSCTRQNYYFLRKNKKNARKNICERI